ncbi:MAG: 4-(cytidine 5'-diphospho)-2-C-methyl-D-erythritol kinase [Bacteroidia bacterium]|nr:4-(cytidine 5'-diphospho)-2-C-methyl-D-erythritol kinase [Bacteroidia bacterium]
MPCQNYTFCKVSVNAGLPFHIMFARMISYPNAKINIGLNILARRKDGYHEIESVMYPVPLTDILEVNPANEKFPGGFQSSGIRVTASDNENLVQRAFWVFKREFGSSDMYIHLHKQIPHAAGLGGGSADAAFALKLFSFINGTEISHHLLRDAAAELGSDCAFFIDNLPALATGRGEKLTPVEPVLNGYFLVIIKPAIEVSTAWAYSKVNPRPGLAPMTRFYSMNVDQWKETMFNDFEEPLFFHFPVLQEIKKFLYSQGAVYASMSGSGPSVYGIFKKEWKMKKYQGSDFIWSGWIT